LAIDLVVAGVSERSEPVAFLLCNHDRHVSLGLAPWMVIDMPEVAMLPLDDQGQRELDGMRAGRSVDDLDPVIDGVRMLEIQRRMSLRFPVGGFAQLASVGAGSISTRIVCRW
jgi:hypothetical protein